MSALALHDVVPAQASLAELKRRVQAQATKRPGVYQFLDQLGGVIYVGKAKDVRTRLLSYFSAPWPDSKSARLIRCAADIRWRYVPSEFEALLEEQRLIQQLRPGYNVAHNRTWATMCFIRVTRGDAPRLVVSETPTGTGAHYYGPFSGGANTREAVRTLSDLLGLRDCAERQPMAFADQPSLFDAPLTPACIRHELGTCLGPCAARCGRDRYDVAAGAAVDFLEGRTAAPLDRVLDMMNEAALAQQYERAALWRERFDGLTWLFGALSRLRAAVEGLSFVYEVGEQVYLVRHGTIRTTAARPTTPIEREAFAESVRLAALDQGPAPAARSSAEMQQLLLVMSWFRQHPEEYDSTSPYSRWISA